MTRLIIRNIGPVKSVDIILNKVNVIIGPQSSGKSTINKIACYCTWVEKKVSLDQSFDFFLVGTNFLNKLVEFHKMNGYFRDGSYVEYCSDVLKFKYAYGKASIPSFEWMNQYGYKRTKISYIPAERNIVSLIAGWNQVNLPDNNIFNFMKDWNMARKSYFDNNSLQIDHIHSRYYYEEETETDFLKMDDGHRIRLMDASSGQQSLVPLYLLVLYFTRAIYDVKQVNSVKQIERDIKLSQHLMSYCMKKTNNNDLTSFGIDDFKKYVDANVWVNELGEKELNEKAVSLLKLYSDIHSNFLDTKYSSLFIEEPELSLFPSTQRDLLYFILRLIQEKEHVLFITTHSPYVLYALNNCIIGNMVRNKIPVEVTRTLKSFGAWIDAEKVSVWQVENGELVSIQGNHRSIGKHYFNNVMNDILDEYYMMLNYYDD